MANPNRRAGTIYFAVDGTRYDAKGNWTYNLGGYKNETMVGADGIHGYKQTTRVPFIEGQITDSASVELKKLQALDGVTITLELANGKTITLSNAWYAADGDVTTEESEIQVRFEGLNAEEVDG